MPVFRTGLNWLFLVQLGFTVAQQSCPTLDNPREIKLSSTNPATISFTDVDYVGDIDCFWIVHNDDTCDGIPVVELTVKSFDTEYWFDLLNVYDSDLDGIQGKQIDSLSGQLSMEEVVESNTESMYLHFASDMDNFGYGGFDLEFKPVCKPPLPSNYEYCKPISEPLVLQNASGEIEFVAETYQDHLECGWLLRNTNTTCPDPRIHVDFHRFGTELSHDYLTLYNQSISDTEAADIKVYLMARYSGPFVYNGPGSFRTDGPELFITFNSDEGVSGEHYEGFSVTYEMVCGDIQYENCPAITDPMVITSSSSHAPTSSPTVSEVDLPFNPMQTFFDLFNEFLGGMPPGVDGALTFHSDHYKNNQKCGWLITNSDSSCDYPIVRLNFPVFSTEKQYDTVSIYDGPSDEYVKLGTWSGSDGTDSPGTVSSTGKDIFIKFESDRGVTYDGFTATYTFACGSAPDENDKVFQCPAWSMPRVLDYQDSQGVHHMDGYALELTKDAYEDNIDCVWEIRNNRYDCNDGIPIVRLDFEQFATELIHDFMVIYDGDDLWTSVNEMRTSGETPQVLAGEGVSYSGSKAWEVPHVYLSNSDVVRIYFKADATMSGIHGYEGFKAHIDFPCSKSPQANTTSLVSWDCVDDHLAPVMKLYVDGELTEPVQYGHHSLPVSLGYPHFIEHGFDGVSDQALIKTRKEPVIAAAVRGMDMSKDGVQTGTSFCCGALDTSDPAHNLAGKIAVCDRGECIFATKARTVQAAGALGLIVVDYDEAGVKMASNSPLPDVNILAGSVRNSFGNILDSIIQQGAQPIMTIGPFICDMHTHNPTKAPTIKPTRNPTYSPTVPGETARPTVSPTIDYGLPPEAMQMFSYAMLSDTATDCFQQRMVDLAMDKAELCLDGDFRETCLYTCCEHPQMPINLDASSFGDDDDEKEKYEFLIGDLASECYNEYEDAQLEAFERNMSYSRVLEVDVLEPTWNEIRLKATQHELLNELAMISNIQRAQLIHRESHHGYTNQLPDQGNEVDYSYYESSGKGMKITRVYIEVHGRTPTEAEKLRRMLVRSWNQKNQIGDFYILNIHEPLEESSCVDQIDSCEDDKLHYRHVELDNCVCKSRLTGPGAFLLVIVPLAIVTVIAVLCCCYIPSCALYKMVNKGEQGGADKVSKGKYKYSKAAELAEIKRAGSIQINKGQMASDDFDDIQQIQQGNTAPYHDDDDDDDDEEEGDLEQGAAEGEGFGFGEAANTTGGGTTDGSAQPQLEGVQNNDDDDDEDEDDENGESTV